MNPFIFQLITAAIGAGFGYIWYRLVGCRTGVCPLTSTPGGSMFAGAVAGFLAAGSMMIAH